MRGLCCCWTETLLNLSCNTIVASNTGPESPQQQLFQTHLQSRRSNPLRRWRQAVVTLVHRNSTPSHRARWETRGMTTTRTTLSSTADFVQHDQRAAFCHTHNYQAVRTILERFQYWVWLAFSSRPISTSAELLGSFSDRPYNDVQGLLHYTGYEGQIFIIATVLIN